MTMTKTILVSSVMLVSMPGLACSPHADRSNGVAQQESANAVASAAERRPEPPQSADSSPFVVGVWKFVAPDGGAPTADTEFRFINPSKRSVTLEYAFFELDGTFCGCDRDDFPPNQTTIYTMLAEATTPLPNNPSLHLFNCTGTSGALKSIAFKARGQEIALDGATQVGFQTHAFGSIVESPNFDFLTGAVMTEAPLQGIAITESTLDDVRLIHQRCVDLLGPL